MSSNSLIKLIKERRTHYALGKDLPVGKDKIQEIVNEAVQHVPSSFNSQSNRVVVLFGDEHDKFWNLVAETLKAVVPAEGWAETEARNNGFKAAAGTVSSSVSLSSPSHSQTCHPIIPYIFHCSTC